MSVKTNWRASGRESAILTGKQHYPISLQHYLRLSPVMPGCLADIPLETSELAFKQSININVLSGFFDQAACHAQKHGVCGLCCLR